MFKNNRNLFIIAVIAVVNALGYGIIIPVLYSYSVKYGLSDFQNGLLFALFSLGQFLSTPVIGRLSDKYGRRPLLIISLAGTALSFFLMAFAPNAIFLFIARALDGLTAGNIPVASAVISDTTDEKDRARGFGIIGASFGFGFVFGPTISALTVGVSAALPFIIAGAIALLAMLMTVLMLPETNKHIGQVGHKKLFDFKKLATAVFDRETGMVLLITLLHAVVLGLFVYAFQPFSVKVLGLTQKNISWVFTMFGVVGLIGQMFLVPKLSKKFGAKIATSSALAILGVAFIWIFGIRSLFWFIPACVLLGLANSSIMPLVQTILSKETDAKSQGTIMGLQTSYMSVGQIAGPILGGSLATIAITSPFLAGGVIALICFTVSLVVVKR